LVNIIADECKEGFWEIKRLDNNDHVFPNQRVPAEMARSETAYRLGAELGGMLPVFQKLCIALGKATKVHHQIMYYIRFWLIMGVCKGGHLEALQWYMTSTPEEIEQRRKEYEERKWEFNPNKHKLTRRWGCNWSRLWHEEMGKFGHLHMLKYIHSLGNMDYDTAQCEIYVDAFCRDDNAIANWIKDNYDFKYCNFYYPIRDRVFTEGLAERFIVHIREYGAWHWINYPFNIPMKLIEAANDADRPGLIAKHRPLRVEFWKLLNREILPTHKWIKRAWIDDPTSWPEKYRVSIDQLGLPISYLKSQLQDLHDKNYRIGKL
jgi:hypothetical protein